MFGTKNLNRKPYTPAKLAEIERECRNVENARQTDENNCECRPTSDFITANQTNELNCITKGKKYLVIGSDIGFFQIVEDDNGEAAWILMGRFYKQGEDDGLEDNIVSDTFEYSEHQQKRNEWEDDYDVYTDPNF